MNITLILEIKADHKVELTLTEAESLYRQLELIFGNRKSNPYSAPLGPVPRNDDMLKSNLFNVPADNINLDVGNSSVKSCSSGSDMFENTDVSPKSRSMCNDILSCCS